MLGCGHASTANADGKLVVGQGASDGGGKGAPLEWAAEDDALVPINADDASRGSRLAYVTVVVFSDFQCPYCSDLEKTLDRVREEYGEDKLRIVFKNSPLSSHMHARLAAEVGQGVLALGGQEAFWRYHAMVFRRQDRISPESIRAWAITAGVDPRALESGLEKKTWASKIDSDLLLAKKLSVNGTPQSFVNGISLGGAQPFERFKQVIDEEITKGQMLALSGVPRDKIYARLATQNYKPDSDDDDDADARAAAQAAKEAAAAAEMKIVYKVPAGSGPVRGPKAAQVTIVELSDFQCPFCKRGAETLERIRREYGDKVRVIWRDMPLSFHEHAEPAAELARAARAQKGDAGFWAVHDLLFDAQPNLDDANLERIAREAKLDVTKAMAAVKAKSFKKVIDEDLDVGDDFQAAGTPHFFVNGHRVVGAKSFDVFKALIDDEIVKADALLKQGTSREALYDTLIKDGKLPPEPTKKEIAAAPANAPFRGTANAKVVIQEVADFQCPYCKRGDAVMEELLKAYPGKIKIVWRDKPLSMHKDAPLAAEAAREAFAQKGNEGFTRMHRLMFENQHALKRDDLESYARTIGLDMPRFQAALDSRAHQALVDADRHAADEAGVSGTPAFFVGPYYVSGAAPYTKLRKLVELVLHPPPAPPPAPAPPLPPGLIVKDVTIGSGAAVKSGDKIKVHYVGTLTDGTTFDSSRTRNAPFEVQIGMNRVIKGWELGLVGMRVGGKRKLTIPPDLAYGDQGAGSTIPPKSTLLFDVELLAIEASEPRN